MTTLEKLLFLKAAIPTEPKERTITGNPVSFRTKYAEAMKLVIPFTPVQAGSGTPSPENVRAISGFDAVYISVTGKNLLNQAGTNTGNGYVYNKFLNEQGELVTPQNVWVVTEYARVEPNKTYTISGLRSACYTCEYDENYNFVKSHAQSSSITFTTSSETHFIRVSRQPGHSSQGNTQLEEGSIATTFEAFGTEYTVAFPDAAGTVYGGTLTVNDDGTGTLVVDRGVVTLTDVSQLSNFKANYKTADIPIVNIKHANNKVMVQASNCLAISYDDRVSTDVLNMHRAYSYASGITLRLPSTASASAVGDVFAAFEGGQYVYELSTPVTYNLTPDLVKSIIGVNNVWTNTNGQNEITYLK